MVQQSIKSNEPIEKVDEIGLVLTLRKSVSNVLERKAHSIQLKHFP